MTDSVKLLLSEMEENGGGFRGVGGTPGGVSEFLFGLGMTIGGAYMLMTRVVVESSYWSIWGYNTFGLSLLPLAVGIGLLFFNGRSKLGWLLLFASCIIIFSGVLMNLQIYFQPTSLFNTLLMLTLLAGGIGLIARSLRAH